MNTIERTYNIVPKCDCVECTIQVTDQRIDNMEWIPTGRASTVGFVSPEIVEIDGECETAEMLVAGPKGYAVIRE